MVSDRGPREGPATRGGGEPYMNPREHEQLVEGIVQEYSAYKPFLALLLTSLSRAGCSHDLSHLSSVPGPFSIPLHPAGLRHSSALMGLPSNTWQSPVPLRERSRWRGNGLFMWTSPVQNSRKFVGSRSWLRYRNLEPLRDLNRLSGASLILLG